MMGLYGIDPAAARKQALYRGLIDAGGAMLAQGPTPYPQNFGQTVGRGLLGFNQGTQAGMDDYYRQQMFGMQAQNLQAETEQRQAEQAEAARRQAAIEELIPTLPPEVQATARAFPEVFAKEWGAQMFAPAGSVMTPEQETATFGEDKPGTYYNMPGEAPKLIEGTAPPKPGATIEAYNLAVEQGYKGTFMQYQTDIAAAGRAPDEPDKPTLSDFALVLLNKRAAGEQLTPDEQAAWDMYTRVGIIDQLMRGAVNPAATTPAPNPFDPAATMPTETPAATITPEAEATALAQAREAVSAGRDEAAVKAMLKEMGIDPGKL